MVVACQSRRTVTDVDHNVYPILTIGQQTWLGANLRVIRSADGRPLVTHHPNNDSAMAAAYGLLYDWTNAQRACMRGWHLPSDSEWSALSTYLGRDAGGSLKDTTLWEPPNVGATNKSKFAARPSGYWSGDEFASLFGRTAVYWSATPQDTHFVWTRTLSTAHDSLRRVTQHPGYGFAIRCLRN